MAIEQKHPECLGGQVTFFKKVMNCKIRLKTTYTQLRKVVLCVNEG